MFNCCSHAIGLFIANVLTLHEELVDIAKGEGLWRRIDNITIDKSRSPYPT
jgi:hypothetical protein